MTGREDKDATAMTMRRVLIFLPLLGIAGCAAGPGLESRMAAYTGASEQTLVRDLGVPDRQITLKNGDEYLAYVRQRTVVNPGAPGFFGGPFWGGPWGGYYGGFPPTVSNLSCEITFLLHDGKVQSFTLRGNDCQ